jgi:glutamate dehydrogenase/leucine dehydrogenase
MRAALEALDGDASLADRRVHVVGVGHVGAPLVELLVAEGARVSVSDVFADRVAAVVTRHRVDAHPPGDALGVECDVLAPCALGGVIDDVTIPKLRCRAIVGAANNQLGSDGAAERLAERGVLFVPDFVASAGGIINIAEEFVGYSHDRALERAEGIEQTMTRVFALARERSTAPGAAATAMARARLDAEGAGRRWSPGDPAAWTGGAPLQRLRPATS